ncbi:hypothetical protein [Kineococcus sp. SYSU DK005]|uniref:hypothetical protein n=1 Tax=Kineococcus sp. SYSU DK005 TaxID=3383126 RepID=UPI003D7CF285
MAELGTGTLELGELTDADAQRYCRRFAAQQPLLLAELITWVADTGGPLDELDATWASLVPLWRWYVSFAEQGFPGIPGSVRPLSWVPVATPGCAHDVEPGAVQRRSSYAAQAVAAYCYHVLQRLAPQARWVPIDLPGAPGVRVHGHQLPALEVGGLLPLSLHTLSGLCARLLDEDPLWAHVRQPQALVQHLQRVSAPFVPGLWERPLAPDAACLPAPGRRTPAWPYAPFEPTGGYFCAQRLGPRARQGLPRPPGAEQAPWPHDGELLRFPFVISTLTDRRRRALLEEGVDVFDAARDVARLPPIPSAGLHEGLIALGFTGPDSPRLDEQEQHYLFMGQEAGLEVYTECHGGRLRLVRTEPIGAQGCSLQSPTGRWLVHQLQLLAAELGAGLHLEDV